MPKTTGGEPGPFCIAQLSDIHCGDAHFDERLLLRAVSEIVRLAPDLIVVSGDLTANGFREEFEEARAYLDGLKDVGPMIVIPGNHDARNVGWVHFEHLFGARSHSSEYPIDAARQGGGGCVKVVAVDSSRPDVNDGELGRQTCEWAHEQLLGDYALRVFVLHHHLAAIPGTGRERSVVLDGGDALWAISRAHCDLALSGHKHVPWVWPTGNAFIIASGTAGTRRLRGDTPPSYNVIRVTPEELEITFRNLDGDRHLVQRYERRPRYRRVEEVVTDEVN